MTQQTPYIGSKISLISKLDIRYEGILYTVDTNESTIALAKVRSFGTEDRPTSNPVAARDDVYEYIIFKATDIKDLIVCETPKPVPQLASASRSESANRISPPDSSGHLRAPGAGRNNSQRVAGSQSNTIQTATGQLNYQNTGVQQAYAQGQQNNNYRNGNRGSVYARGGVSYQRNRGGGGGGGTIGKPQSKEKLKFESDYDFEKANEQFQETLNSITNDLKKSKLEGQLNYQNTGVQQAYAQGQQNNNYRNGNRGSVYARGGVSYQRNRGGGGGGTIGKPQSKEKLKFESDYDFEKANEQFQETLNSITNDLKKSKLEGVCSLLLDKFFSLISLSLSAFCLFFSIQLN
ncbi:unnamed protein product [Gongylonema pulchrum]|uniref:LSM14 domain-containing protein n=2 Tax=Gongylonema pulchrum TaxID=637853 RepID=A0A183E2F0_9BILA|nr:unnamed protein product [Gongylonema pulchrum]